MVMSLNFFLLRDMGRNTVCLSPFYLSQNDVVTSRYQLLRDSNETIVALGLSDTRTTACLFLTYLLIFHSLNNSCMSKGTYGLIQ